MMWGPRGRARDAPGCLQTWKSAIDRLLGAYRGSTQIRDPPPPRLFPFKTIFARPRRPQLTVVAEKFVSQLLINARRVNGQRI